MKLVKLLIATIALMSLSPVLFAQEDYDFYLQKARQRLAEGDCTRAEASYNTYKDMAHKTNNEIERLIEVCKNGSSDDFGGNLTLTVDGISYIMKPVEGGIFWMGSQKTDPNGINYDNWSQFDEDLHNVTVSSFYIGETEVTQALWKAVMSSNPSYFKGDKLPVESVSWDDVQLFIRKLNKLTGKNFRLPTEAEWEYAVRAGTHTALYNGKNYFYEEEGDYVCPNLDPIAWCPQNCGMNYTSAEGCDVSNGRIKGTHPVKRKLPNLFGLYDMLGNVREWCQDWYDGGYYKVSPSVNPQGPSSSSRDLIERNGKSYRVTRGGSWGYRSFCHRVSDRGCDDPDKRDNNIGFRLVLSK